VRRFVRAADAMFSKSPFFVLCRPAQNVRAFLFKPVPIIQRLRFLKPTEEEKKEKGILWKGTKWTVWAGFAPVRCFKGHASFALSSLVACRKLVPMAINAVAEGMFFRERSFFFPCSCMLLKRIPQKTASAAPRFHY
jgi:hypothetical protein